MVTKDNISRRLEKLEKQKKEEALTLIEILSNATFFGEIRKAKCQHSRNGQCCFFILEDEAKYKLPIVTACRIENCEEFAPHSHIEISNITCSLCQEIGSSKKSFGNHSNSLAKSNKKTTETKNRIEE
jgi:hypothetical protein